LRTGQEALSNVRHADAGRVEVTLTFLPDSVSLDIVDDGHGFDPLEPRTADGTGLGLNSMRRRLAEVGGRLVVESSPGEGTAIGASIPVGSPGPETEPGSDDSDVPQPEAGSP
ncbi:MAG: sensor histidine kinase, partial [Stackebrandtia sp.]